jgi:RNA repair pathway DNA polymerase beta family
MNKILSMTFGSHLYGTNTPASDTDIKGIYLPTAREIVLGSYKKTIATCRAKQECERNTKDDTDTEFFSLDRYLELLMQGQTVALDMLFAPKYDCPGNRLALWSGFEIMHEIRDNKDKLLTRNVNAFVGYARQQAAKYGIKGSRLDALKRTMELLDSCNAYDPHLRLAVYGDRLETLVKESSEMVSLEKTPLIEIVNLKGPTGLVDQPHLRVNGRAIPFHATVKYAREVVGKMYEGYGLRAHKAHLAGGVDWKALSHAVRVNSEALELLTTGHITFPRPDRELLIQIKQGQLEYEQVAGLIEQGLADLHSAHLTSTLRDTPDKEWADNLVYEVYSQIVRES